jgi:sn-glycerol 3-phosphate transport system substrate-binding protein
MEHDTTADPHRPRSHSRRWRALLALTAGVALVGAACGGGDDGGSDEAGGESAAGASECPYDALDDAEGPVEVTVWHTEIGLPGQTLEQLAQQYNDSQDKVVVNVEYQGTFDEQKKKYTDAMADPDTLPAIIQPDDTITQFMADSGTAIPAQACIEADPEAAAIYDDMVPIVPAAYTIGDVLWPAAFSASGAAMYANVRILEAAGLDPNALPSTLAELRAAAEQIKAAGVAGVEEPLVMRIESWPLEFWTSGAQTPVVNEDNGRAALATESEYANDTTQEILDWLRQMELDGLLKYTDYSDLVAPFLSMAGETSAFLIDTSAAISTVNSAIEGTLRPDQVGLEEGTDLSGLSFPDLRLTVGMLPGLTEPGKGQMGGAAWYLVDVGDPAIIAGAWDFMKWFNQTEQQVTWAIDASYFPVRQSAVDDPELQAYWSDTVPGQWMASAYQGFTSLDPDFPGPVIGPYTEYRQAVKNGLEQIILNGADVAATMDAVDAEFQVQLDEYADDVAG